MASLDDYLAAHDAQAARPTRPQAQTLQQRRPHARSLSTRSSSSQHSIVAVEDENDAAAANGVPRSSPPTAAVRRDSYQTAKSRLLAQSSKLPGAERLSGTQGTAANAAQKPLLVKSAAGTFTRRPSSAASAASVGSRSRRAAVNSGMSAREFDALHSPSPPRVSPAKTGLYPLAGAHSRRTSSVSFAASTFGSPAVPALQPQQQQQQHAAFVPASPPAGWFSPARSHRGHAIPAGSDHVPWRPSPDAAASLFNAAESSPVGQSNADRARFQAEVERAVFTPPRDSALNAPNFATRRFTSPASIAGAPAAVFHSPLSSSWIQALRARTARIMNLASTNAAASGNSPPFDPRATAMAQAGSPFDPHAPAHSASSLARTRDRIAKQNLILSPSILRAAPDGGASLVSTPGTPALDSRGHTPPPPPIAGAQQRFAGMGAGLPAFMLRSPTILARHRAALAESASASAAAAAAAPVASASARQEAHQTLLAQNPQRQQLLHEYRQGLREIEMGATSALQSLAQPPQPQQHQPAPQPFTSQILPVPIVAARAVQSMESLPAPQPMHRSPPPAATAVQHSQGRGHSVATSPMAFSSPARASPAAAQPPQRPQHASPFVHRMIGSARHGHSHDDDDACDECASHAHHHHALAPRAALRRDVQTSPLALMPSAAVATRSAMTSPILVQQPQQFGSPLRSSPIRPAVAPSVASFASSTTASSLPVSQPTQPLSLADRINSNLAGLRQLNSRANQIAARSPAVPAPSPTAGAQALPNDTTTIPAAHEAHRNVLQRIDRIVNLTKQPVAVESQAQKQRQASFFPVPPGSERSFLSMPTPAALPVHAEAKYADSSDAHQPLLHDISELTNSAMEDSRASGDASASALGGNRSSFFPPQAASQAQAMAEAQDQERFRMWQQRLAQNQMQLQQQQQQQQQPVYSAPPVTFAQQPSLQHLPPFPQQPQQHQEPVFHSDGISDALAQSLRNIQSLRSSLASSRGVPQQQHAQSQPAPMQSQPQYAPSALAYSQPYATAHLHPYADSEPSHDSSDRSGSGVRLELHHPSAESTSIRVGAVMLPEFAPALPHLPQLQLQMQSAAGVGWTLPSGWMQHDSSDAATKGWKPDFSLSQQQDQDQQRRASIATTICSDSNADLSPARAGSSAASSAGSSRTTTPPSAAPALTVPASFVPFSPQPLAFSTGSAAAAASTSRARLHPFTPIAASGIFDRALRGMALESTPAAASARGMAMARKVQASPQQAEMMQQQQRHNASTLSLLNRQGD